MKNLLIIGNPEKYHIGHHIHFAAQNLNIPNYFYDVRKAFAGNKWIDKIPWILGRRPALLNKFSREALDLCKKGRVSHLITIGIIPPEKKTLYLLGELKIQRINYSTDDPWNRLHHAPWFLESIPFYDHIFTTRTSNISDFFRSGCKSVHYLPFAYSPEIHFSAESFGEQNVENGFDVLFIGGGDPDRVPFVHALIQSGFKVGLFGGYWDRFKETRKYAGGHLTPEEIRQVTFKSKICLCLMRRANRDDNVMRSFEIPAMGGCMLAEDTKGHREIFGDDGKFVMYFKDIREMLEKTEYLIRNVDVRRRLADSAHELIAHGKHTYQDRLASMCRIACDNSGTS